MTAIANCRDGSHPLVLCARVLTGQFHTIHELACQSVGGAIKR
jgi:hypothetical protein